MTKRILDVVVATCAAVVVSPLMVVVAIAIRLDSRGPALHRGYRVGKAGREFRLWKFRSMITNAHKHGPPITAHGDPRVTRVGRFLRRWKIDELPQLANVIKGDMSLVGPRPEDPTYVALYTAEQQRILKFQPGITSPASIAFRNEEDVLYYGDLSSAYLQKVLPAKLAIDFEYFERATFWGDLVILGRTVAAVLVGSKPFRHVSMFGRAGVRWLVLDAVLVVLGFYTALVVRFLDNLPQDLAPYLPVMNLALAPLVAVYTGVNHLWRLHRRLWQYAAAPEVASIVGASATSTAIVGLVDLLLGLSGRRLLPMSVVVLGGCFTVTGMVLLRYRWRLIDGLWPYGRRGVQGRQRALIYGAGDSGQRLAWRLLTEPISSKHEVVGFMDDDPAKRGLRVHNVPVLGTRAELERIVDQKAVDLIILAMSNIGGEQLRAIVSSAQCTAAKIRIVPSWLESIGNATPSPLVREVRVDDLLGRQSVMVDVQTCSRALKDKVVLVTGGAGSVGAELCRQIVSLAPRQLLVLDNNETALYDLEIDIRTVRPNFPVVSLVGDVTDDAMMDALFRETCPQVVFHAAAYKHVPLMQRYPEEAVRVNVGGTLTAVKKARLYRAERFVLVSTDKAVNPESVMGATKRLAELLVLGVPCAPENDESRRGQQPLCTAVRFGNVLGSRGSVVPTFAKQIELGGPVTVTHPEMTRYFMDISEAATLIIEAAALTEGGETFMLDMGERIRVDDLARKMIRLRGLRPETDIPIVYVGMRPGEKLHEDLMSAGEEQVPTRHRLIYRVIGRPSKSPPDIDTAVSTLLRMASRGQRSELVEELMALTGSRRERLAGR